MLIQRLSQRGVVGIPRCLACVRPTFARTLAISTTEASPSATLGDLHLLDSKRKSSEPSGATMGMEKGHAARIAEILGARSVAPALAPKDVTQSTTDTAVVTREGKKRQIKELTLTEAFVNNIMKDGKKARARRFVREALALIQRETGQDAHEVLEEAVNRVAPLMKLVSVKRGGKGVSTPTPLLPRQRRRLGILWIVDAASSKRGDFGERIGREILAVMDGTSSALQKRMNLHKQALSNRSNVIMRDRKRR
ncbi:hypothetical protein HDU85_001970 [Gaertneriomyces sp. JEL0708]|nr:hypothetical protein HDU85_001970 [Gaertneriomyces sp. JEL0708]